MGFAERAVRACEKAVLEGAVSERHVRDVLRCDVDGAFAVGWLGSEDVMVRRLAARIVSVKGPVEELVRAAAVEKDRALLADMMRMLGRPGVDVGSLEGLLRSEDTIVRDAAVEMFRRAGQASFLFPMVFSEDEPTSQRTKRYMDEEGKDREVSGT